MAVTSVTVTPEVAAIGATVTVLPVGEPNVTADLRYYLLSAPTASALPTLATYEALGLTLADIRLKSNGSNGATFVPDVDGLFSVVVREVIVYRFVPSYGGEVPASGDPAAIDNEEGPFTVNGGVTAQVSDVPNGGAAAWVYRTLSREVGFGTDRATLAVDVYNNQAVPTKIVPFPARLTPGNTAPARVAVRDEQVAQVVAAIAAIESAGHRELAYHATLLTSLVLAYNEHLGMNEYKVHATVADATTDALASTAAVTATTASIGTRLNDIVAKYNAHRVRLSDPVTAGTLHSSADATNIMTAGSVATLSDTIAYYEHVYSVLQAHATRASSHDLSTTNRSVDGYFGWCAEPPTTLDEVKSAINGGGTGSRWDRFGLTDLYEKHRTRSLVKVHATAESLAPDTDNTVLLLNDSVPNLILTANALADSFNRHVQNQDATGQTAGTPYHYASVGPTRRVRTRASDVRSLAVLVEELWICFEAHLWGGGPQSGYVTVTSGGSLGQHPDRAWGGYSLLSAPDGSARPMLMVRLAKAFERALNDSTVTAQSVTAGYLASLAQKFAGFS
jgi:hypothetical protein